MGEQLAQGCIVLLVAFFDAVLLVGRAGFRQETGLETGLFLGGVETLETGLEAFCLEGDEV